MIVDLITYSIIITKYIIITIFGIVDYIKEIAVYYGEKDNHFVDLDKIRNSDEACILKYKHKRYLENNDLNNYEYYDHHIKFEINFDDKKYENMSLSDIKIYFLLVIYEFFY